jgi:hypothetical protein
MGTFSSAVGSTFCTQCPSGTYSSMHGATACSNCPENYWTSEGAQTINACSPCPPGSGSCKTCVFGEYQSMSAQAKCIKCPPGQVSTTANQTTCTPCLPQTFQSSFGKSVNDKILARLNFPNTFDSHATLVDDQKAKNSND